MMSCYDDDHLDLVQIGKELNAAVSADEKYYRENDAKFRAVDQKVASYEEFRDIVLASNIKPLEKGDRISECKMTQPWNQIAAANTGKSPSSQSTTDFQKSYKLPTTGAEFAQQWKRCHKTPSERYNYLLDIGGDKLCDIFTTEISLGLLGEILVVLNSGYNKQHDLSVLHILYSLSTVNRFSLSLQFLNSTERKECWNLFSKLKCDLTEEKDLILLASLGKIYDVK